MRTVEAIVNGNVTAIAQDEMTVGELRPAPKIFRDTCRIDWTKGLCGVYDFVRGMSPYPAAWCEFTDEAGNDVVLKVYDVVKEACMHNKECGTVVTDGKSFVKVAVLGGYVSLVSVQLAGKKRMPIADLLRGFSISGLTLKL